MPVCRECKWISKENSPTTPDYKLCKCKQLLSEYEEVCVKQGSKACEHFEPKETTKK